MPKSLTLLLLLLCFCQLGSKAQGIDWGATMGQMLNVDPDFKCRSKTNFSLHAAYRHYTSPVDSTGFPQAYGNPSFTYGLSLISFNPVSIRSNLGYVPYNSRMGLSLVAYIGFNRPLLRLGRHGTLEYGLQHGLAWSNHTWNAHDNMENELIGSRITAYVGLNLQAVWHNAPWHLRIGPQFRHLSNGALARPNKGANWADLNLSATYDLGASRQKSTAHTTEEETTARPPFQKYFFLEFTYRTGLKTSLGEWLVDRRHHWNGEPLVYGHYPLYVSHVFSPAFYWRYSRKYACGLGYDLLYEPYIGRIEAQNPDRPRSISKFSHGLSVRHRVHYKHLSIDMALGCYLSRPFKKWAVTDEEFGYYERIGFLWALPLHKRRIQLGYNVMAHKTKAYSTEISLAYDLPLPCRKHKHPL